MFFGVGFNRLELGPGQMRGFLFDQFSSGRNIMSRRVVQVNTSTMG